MILRFFQSILILSLATVLSSCKVDPIKVAGSRATDKSGELGYTIDSEGNIIYTNEKVDENKDEVKKEGEKVEDDKTKTDDPKVEVLPTKPPFDNALMCHVRGSTACLGPAKSVAVKKGAAKPKLSGYVFLDKNKNGIRDLGEKGFGTTELYADVNNNCIFDSGDFKISGPFDPNTGYFETYGDVISINNNVKVYAPMPAGEITIRMSEWQSHYAKDGYPAYKFTLGSDGEVENLMFAVTSATIVDKGNAPAYYGEASHNFNPYYYLGKVISANPDPNVCKANDGIVLPPNLTFDSSVYISVLMTGNNAFLSGWIDLNGDGDFTDEGEHVISGTSGIGEVVYGYGAFATTGMQLLLKIPPAVASTPNKLKTWARFRLGDGVPSPFGHSIIGETEDYEIEISR